MYTTDQYLNLITSQHRDKPKFVATNQIFAESMISIQNTADQFLIDFDLDSAVGVQLDTIGLWIGQSRIVTLPLLGYYFTWDDTVQTGWDQGVWWDLGDPLEQSVTLTDQVYRDLLYSKVLANNWDGSVDKAYEIALAAFPSPLPQVDLIDTQDMAVTIRIPSSYTPIQKGLIINGYVILTSEGIRKTIEYF